MTGAGQDEIMAAQRALEQARRAARPVARAARAAYGRQLLAMGAATATAVILSGLVSHGVRASATTLRSVLTGLLWAALFAAATALVSAQRVRPVPQRRKLLAIGLASAVVVAVSMAVGVDAPVAYVVGAGATFGVWAAGARWSGR